MRIIRILFFVLAILSLLYSVIIYSVGSGNFSFVIWIAGTVFFALCYFFSGSGRWGKVPAPARVTVYIVLGLGFAVFLVCQILIFSQFFDKGEKDLDYIIVLGAQMRESGPSVQYRARLDSAAEYLKNNPDTVCITTGGRGSNEPVSEGEGGASYLESVGIAPERIFAETLSVDTPENIRNALDMIAAEEGGTDDLKIGIVTNGFHVYRGVHIAKRMTNASVCGIAAYLNPLYLPNSLVRECFGILRDFLFSAFM